MSAEARIPAWVLPVIVISQFFCTSVWFAGNAVMPAMLSAFHLPPAYLAYLTSAVQLGFISGTLVFAVLTIADRFPPSAVFFASAVVSALFNLGIVAAGVQPAGLLLFRFATGFFLAGVYPVGMKIAADYYGRSLGRSLGFLVGALVLGTAFPHLLRSLSLTFPWQYVAYATSALSLIGGTLVMLSLRDGPYRQSARQMQFAAFVHGFRLPQFRKVVFGYFGHMWELYTFWAFVPVMLAEYGHHYAIPVNVPLLSFIIISSGSLACVLSGILSQYFGAARIATVALSLSCLCCLCSPFMLFAGSLPLLMVFLVFWGMVVIADSPMFSTLVAQYAPGESRGTSLTIVNCIGFAITVISIQVVGAMAGTISPQHLYLLLAPGPVLGLVSLFRSRPRA